MINDRELILDWAFDANSGNPFQELPSQSLSIHSKHFIILSVFCISQCKNPPNYFNQSTN